ncbi:hypothetical protein M758_1G217200 [Ceratodon purpureus]|nr:hypothetical protein M758_1G217200 [Ceratodon purpureus]
MKKATAIHLAYAIAATHFVCAVAIAQHHQFYAAAGPRVIIPERPLPLIPGPGGSWSPSSQPYENLLVSTPQEQASSVLFDYTDGPNGPDHWGELNADWSLCKSGAQQSPLAITPTLMITDSTLGDLKANYTSKPVNATISHDGLNLKVDVPSSAGELKIYNVTYRPASFHFHRPSEHRILNYSFPLELHLVHKSEDDRMAVIAWLFVPGSTNNSFLAQFLDELPSHKKPYANLEISPINLPTLEPNYGRYRGSLTTPPCSETVIWTVMLWNFPSVSDYQLKQLKSAMPRKNARPSFPSRGRKFRINHTPNWTLMKQAFKDNTY